MNKQELKRMHPTGLKGIFHVYDWKRLRRSQAFKVALILTIILAIALPFADRKAEYFTHVQALSELGVAIFPCLLGFTIGAYALIIGFASSSNLKKFTRKAPNSNGSFYQALMSIFSVTILLQTVCIVVSFAVGYIAKSKFTIDLINEYSALRVATNYSITLFISFVSLWSLFTIPYVATNLFNFAQTNHLLGAIERVNDEGGLESEEEPTATGAETND